MMDEDVILDFTGMCPICPDCGSLMGQDTETDDFVCPDCGCRISDDEGYALYEEEHDGDISFGCQACGGPYPSCKSSCNVFDD